MHYFHYQLQMAANLSPLKEGGSLLTDSILLDALLVLGVGFGSVFVVLSLIYLICQLLNRIFPEKVDDA